MNSKTKLMILIILECRLSLKMSCKLFKISEEELQKIVKEETHYKKALMYLFNYETAVTNEQRDKKALFKGTYYLLRINEILRNTNANEQENVYNKLIRYLTDKEIKEFLLMPNIKKRAILWNEERRLALLKYKLKNALSSRKLQQNYRLDNHIIAEWIKELEEGEFKEKLIMLNEFHYDINAIKARRKKYV